MLKAFLFEVLRYCRYDKVTLLKRDFFREAQKTKHCCEERKKEIRKKDK